MARLRHRALFFRMQAFIHLCLIILTWSAYFALHSALASAGVKHWLAQRFPAFMPLYRVTYNLLALIFLIPPSLLTLIYPGPELWRWRGPLGWLADGLALAAVAGFVWSLRYYDGMNFLGLRQWRDQSANVDGSAQFTISPLHRYVRHPWYFFMLVILWTRDMTAGGLVFAVVATLYLVIGSRYEEEKLIALHGNRYVDYRARVAGLIPRRGRTLTEAEARQLSTPDKTRT